MTYQRFEDLPVWQQAARLYEQTDDLLEAAPARVRGAFRNQLERAALSVSNNIAEGFERGTTAELLSFLYIARGSAGEVRSMLTLLERRPWMADFKAQITDLRLIAESCSRQLRGWAESLQNSEIKGQRHLNERERKRLADDQRASAFRLKLLKMLPATHPLRKEAEERGDI